MKPTAKTAVLPVRMTVEDETTLLARKQPGIVPFFMEQTKSGIFAEVYAGVRAEAEAFLSDYADRLFSSAALRAVSARMDPYLASVGYERDRYGELRYYLRLELHTKEALICPPLPTEHGARLQLLCPENAATLRNATTLDLQLLSRRPFPCAILTVPSPDEAGETAVAVAAVNDASEGATLLELTVETAPAYRKNGFGKAVTALLCRTLLENGFSVAYCCSRWNTASKKLALSLGFSFVGRMYAVTAYTAHTS